MIAAEELHELIRCALNTTMRVYPASFRRECILLGLIQAGYMIPVIRIGDPNFHPDSVSMLPEHEPITFTNRGRDHVLTLNPADFESVKSRPLPDDIRMAQTAIEDINHHMYPISVNHRFVSSHRRFSASGRQVSPENAPYLFPKRLDQFVATECSRVRD